MTMQEFEIAMLALCAWREAGGQGMTGMQAVMCVIRNRVRVGSTVDPGWTSWLGVIFQHNAFSSMTVLGDGQTIKWPTDDIRVTFSEILDLARNVYSLSEPDNTGGALYYANLQTYDAAGWFARNIVGKPAEHPVTATIEAHTFYA